MDSYKTVVPIYELTVLMCITICMLFVTMCQMKCSIGIKITAVSRSSRRRTITGKSCGFQWTDSCNRNITTLNLLGQHLRAGIAWRSHHYLVEFKLWPSNLSGCSMSSVKLKQVH